MEFTCLWSKDAQQKKRKRWTDGVIRYDPATGFVGVWDQDESMKISSTRLKPDEASAVLQEDGEERRVGSISLQIMAKIDVSSNPPPALGSGNRQPRGPLATLNTTLFPTTGKSAQTGGSIPRRDPGAVGKARDVGIDDSTVHPKSSLSAPNGNNDTTGNTGLGRKRPLFRPLVPKSRDATQEKNHDGEAPRAATAGAGTARRAAGAASFAGKVRAGVGSARRFHAPRASSGMESSSGASHAEVSTVISGDLLNSSAFTSIAGGRQVRRGLGASRNEQGETASSSGGLGVRHSGVDTPSGGPIAPVAVDPEDVVLEWTNGNPPQPVRAGATLARRLHPHQREGLKLLWECLTGRGGYEGRGAILADEMGLGKTATAIALCTCMLRHRRAECRKAVVVCPSSLVKNWANEFRKWCPLGGGAVAVEQAGAAAAQLVADFKIGAAARYPILIISYELYRNHGKVINSTEGLGLLIADEGHRLKNSSETKTTKTLKACPVTMRLVLTGTPMQNDLDEFFAVADFVNPGLLGDLKTFRSRYTRPIKAAWDREADSQVTELAAERTRELGELTEKFVLRRTKDVIQGSLPPALEVVVFCRPSQEQLRLYESFIDESSGARALLGGVGGEDGGVTGMQGVLPLISTLRRLCNHPDLVKKSNAGHDCETSQAQEDDEEVSDEDDTAFLLVDEDDPKSGDTGNGSSALSAGAGAAARRFKAPRLGRGLTVTTTTPLGVSEEEMQPKYETQVSGKLVVLEALLEAIRQRCSSDKVVISSNFTSTLDVLGCVADRNGWSYLRLDGGTASSKRQALVDRFNKASPSDVFLFFLSAKAGGVGLNLVGANRIILFDSDWNPATDDQAMARVWRLGQKKEVSTYRFLTTGTLEESIFQRQIFKGALYDLIQDSNKAASSYSRTRSAVAGLSAQLKNARYANGYNLPAEMTKPVAGGGGDERERAARRNSRGFSQEELRDLFVLKTKTPCDTFDKLKQGRGDGLPNDTQAEGEMFVPSDTKSEEKVMARTDGHILIQVDRTLANAEESGDVVETSTQEQGLSVASTWKAYEGPEHVVDDPLRWALDGMGQEAHSDDNDVLLDGRRGVSDAVSFVHEVKKGVICDDIAMTHRNGRKARLLIERVGCRTNRVLETNERESGSGRTCSW